jgi:SAM-dependent methyltransferase
MVNSAMDRLSSEQLFHDDQARRRAEHFTAHPQALLVNDADYLAHESWIAPAMAQLGDVRGLRILDLGCGHGMASVVLARRGARVTACDLSAGYLAEVAARARANGVAIQRVQLDGDRLPFGDGSFDRIWGNAILHHLNVEKAGREIYRVLVPGGLAVLCEPWGENPLLNTARMLFPYSGKHRTPDEQPLRRHDIRALEMNFPRVEQRGFQFLSMVRRTFPSPFLVGWLDRCDARLLAWFPGLQQYCRYMLLTLYR